MLKIMIVDDMEIVRRELKRVKLWGEESGFIISEEACDGHEALEKLRCSAVDMIITDIRMPRIDGIELLKKVAEEKLCTCFIIMSDYSEFNYVRQGLVLGAFDYIVKPVDEYELKNLLVRAKDYILERKSEQQRVKQLEQSLADKQELYFSQAELNRLTELVKSGDERAVEYGGRLADIVASRVDGDAAKLSSALNGIYGSMTAKLKEADKWLNKFVGTDSAEMLSFTRLDDMRLIKAHFISVLDSLVELLSKLKCGKVENQVVNQVCKFVLENIDGDISLKVVSDLIFMNRTYISEVFKQKTGISFTEYLTTVKMERAKKLLSEERLKTYEIAGLLGYKDIEYFSKQFKKYTGFPPSEYKLKSIKII